VAASGLDCALGLPGDHPRRGALVESLLVAVREVVSDPAIPVAADDRSSVFGVLVGAEQSLGDSAAARATAGAWAAFLETEAARAATPEARAVFDSHRLGAYLELGQPERAIPMLEASERDLPEDYNPPARLALAYLELGRHEEALAASDRALARVYGPRKLRVLSTRADIQTAMADTSGARRTLEDALALAESLPEGQRSERTIAGLKRRLGRS
jgi:tetratricopeptide (TPR) repeat protein